MRPSLEAERESHAVCIFAHHFGPCRKPVRGTRAEGSPKLPQGALGFSWSLCPKGNCSACLIYGCESATKLKLRNSETEAEARTETVISCDAWPKPQLSPPSSLAYPFHSRKLGTRDSSLVTHQP